METSVYKYVLFKQFLGWEHPSISTVVSCGMKVIQLRMFSSLRHGCVHCHTWHMYIGVSCWYPNTAVSSVSCLNLNIHSLVICIWISTRPASRAAGVDGIVTTLVTSTAKGTQSRNETMRLKVETKSKRKLWNKYQAFLWRSADSKCTMMLSSICIYAVHQHQIF